MVYLLVSIWVPLYFSFLPLIEFWLVSLLVLAVAVLLDSIAKLERLWCLSVSDCFVSDEDDY